MTGRLARLVVSVAIGAFVIVGSPPLQGAPAPPSELHFLSDGNGVTNGLGSGMDFFVATIGLDSNPGTQQQPLATLEAARDAIRRLKTTGGLPANGITVWIRNGSYYRSTGFTLDDRDSGTQQAPIIYRAYPNETVVFTGAKSITNFMAVTAPLILSRLKVSAQTNVLVANISTLAVSDYGSLSNRGVSLDSSAVRSGFPRPWMVELFFDNHRQQISRWPNQDKSEEVWAYTTTPTPGMWKEDSTDNWFTYRESNPSTWALTETVWVHGGWTYFWDDSYEQVMSINSATNRITTDCPGDNGYSANSPYEALNVLEELDQAGEWVIDRVNSLIYFWPSSTNANQRTTLSVLVSDFVALTNASSIQLQNLTFESSRGSGMSMRNSTNILVAGCEFRNLGNIGVVVGNSVYTNTTDTLPLTYDYQGGQSNQIIGCYLHDLGQGGIVLSGGDRSTLTPSGHVARNNYIHDYNTNIRCYHPAIRLDGVGHTVSHTVIHDSPHQAIWFSGNDHLIEYCNIYRVCKETEDAGAIYCVARDWKQQGTVIRYNLIQPSRESGIYLDDFTSGVTAYGNVIMNVTEPFLIGGGRNNVFSNNIVVGYSSDGWLVDSRGTTWATGSISGLVLSLQQVGYTNSPYSKYPAMAGLYTDIINYNANQSVTNLSMLGTAKSNHCVNNLLLSAYPHSYSIDTNQIDQTGNIQYIQFPMFSGFTASPTINAIATRNFALAPNSAPILAGFQQIPQSQIGIYDDSYGLVTRSMVPPYPPIESRAPFKTLTIPGKVQVEDYDEGSSGDASTNSFALDYGNNAWGFGRYRLESPFYIWGSFVNGHREYAVAISYPPAWLEYTVNIAQAGTYSVAFSYESMKGYFHLELDGTQIASGMTGTNSTATVSLPQGTHVLRLVCDVTGGSRLDYIDFQKVP